MFRIVLFLLFTTSCFGEELLPIETSEKNPYTLRVRLCSLEEAVHHLGGGDDWPQSFQLQVLKEGKIILSLPVRSLPKDLRDEMREKDSALAEASLLTLLWSDDYMYLTIIERYDLGRPSSSSLPSAVTYWFGQDSPVKSLELDNAAGLEKKR